MTAIHILLVEDNEGDIVLTKEALEDSRIPFKLSIAYDGKQAIDFMNERIYSPELPDLLLLDINIPKKNGHEVLHYLKADERLKKIPVIMFTTSSSEIDINLSYNNYANCYITKPVDVIEFISVVATIETYWHSIVRLPIKTANSNDK